MKVFRRILIKVLILAVVICVSGGGAACYQAYRQSTAEYAMNRYLSLLVDNDAEKAFSYVDQSESQKISKTEYQSALDEKRYSLASSTKTEELQKRRDNNGNEYVDYQVQFLDAAGKVDLEETFIVKKQSDLVYGVFDRWKVLSDHCMVKDFVLKVPVGSKVYLNAEKLDASWLQKDGAEPSADSYQIPVLIPGKSSLVIRHAVLQELTDALDATDGSADYVGKMVLKDSAKSECLEMGVKLLRAVYASAAKKKTEDPDELMSACQKAADELIKKQQKVFYAENSEFDSAAISGFAAEYGDVTYGEADGAITMDMTLSYHYLVHQAVTVDTDELQEDGTPVQKTETKEKSGDTKAKLTMSYYENAWHITAIDMQVIPK